MAYFALAVESAVYSLLSSTILGKFVPFSFLHKVVLILFPVLVISFVRKVQLLVSFFVLLVNFLVLVVVAFDLYFLRLLPESLHYKSLFFNMAGTVKQFSIERNNVSAYYC